MQESVSSMRNWQSFIHWAWHAYAVCFVSERLLAASELNARRCLNSTAASDISPFPGERCLLTQQLPGNRDDALRATSSHPSLIHPSIHPFIHPCCVEANETHGHKGSSDRGHPPVEQLVDPPLPAITAGRTLWQFASQWELSSRAGRYH